MKNWVKLFAVCLCLLQVSVAFALDTTTARQAGANWLIERMGDRNGWETFNDASANAIRAFVATGRTDSLKYQQVLDHLLSLRSADGTYPGGSGAIWALAEAGYTKDDPELQEAVYSLMNKYDSITCWGSGVHANALNVIALVKAGIPKTHPCIKGTVNWLKNCQNSDGYWGATSGATSNPWGSPSPISALCLGDSPSSTYVQNAVNYLYSKRNSIEPIDNIVSLEALTYAGKTAQAEVVKNIILNAQMPDGGWVQMVYPGTPSGFLHTAYGAVALGNYGVTGTAIDKSMNWIESHIDDNGVFWGGYQDMNYFLATVAIHSAYPDAQEITDAINAAASVQAPNGSWAWWSYYKPGGSNTGEMPSTTTVLNSIFECEKASSYPTVVSKAVNYLYTARNTDGGWGAYQPSQSYSPSSLSNTIRATEVLLRSGYTTANGVVLGGVNWIISQMDGDAWTVCGSTAMAIRVLHRAGGYEFLVNDAVAWLYANQNPDGGWGPKLGEVSNVGTTSQVLITLGLIGSSNESMVRGAQWLLNAQNPDGGWAAKPGVLSSDTGNTSYAVWALAQDFGSSGDMTVTVSTNKESYVQGETAVVAMEASEDVSSVSCYITDPAGWNKKIYLTKDNATNYHINLVIDQYRLGVYSIMVEAESTDGDINSDVCSFGVEADYIIPGDINKDGIVDINDLMVLATNWLEQE